LVQPIATAGIVLVFIVFVLLQRDNLRDRMIRLFGLGDVHRATSAISDAAKRIGRYLLMQLVINICYGLPIGVGLFLIGVLNALLWGILATLLRFIPYLGTILAAVFPIALPFAVDPGWTTPLLTVALFIGVELLTSNVLEPWLYGSSTGLSPLAITVAAVFWTTLWGPVGLLLATPLTVCMVVLGRHVPQLQFFEVLLGDQPVLAPRLRHGFQKPLIRLAR
jgi:predicted PurR-regulated permease PerM